MTAANTHVKTSIYLDNNATTMMPQEVQQYIATWTNRGNPSASHPDAVAARKMMETCRQTLGKTVGVKTCCPEDRDVTNISENEAKELNPNLYKVIFTSGGSEANSMVIQGIVAAAYVRSRVFKPHIVASMIEHKGTIKTIDQLAADGFASVTYVRPTIVGKVNADDVLAAICPRTCLICIMHANNELGAINPIYAIGKIARLYNIHFHTDAVQSFGKLPPQLLSPDSTIDSCSLSFHKLGGPPGVGALIIRQARLVGFRPIIFGTQNEGLRGGTENVPGIAGGLAATRLAMSGRATKNKYLLGLKRLIVTGLAVNFPTRTYSAYYMAETAPKSWLNTLSGYIRPPPNPPPNLEIVWLSRSNQCIPNTILLSVVRRTKPFVCNTKMKDALQKKGIIISIGSACNTASPKASHVLYAIGADDLIRKGCLRISLCDTTSYDDAMTFVKEFTRIVRAVGQGDPAYLK